MNKWRDYIENNIIFISRPTIYSPSDFIMYFFFFFSFCLFSFFSRVAPVAYGGSHARGLIGAVAAGLRTPEPQQHGIRAASATYTTTHGNAGSLTHWARAGTEPATSWFLVGFVNPCTMMRNLSFFLIFKTFTSQLNPCLKVWNLRFHLSHQLHCYRNRKYGEIQFLLYKP